MLNPDSVGRTFAGADSISISQSDINSFAAVIGETKTDVAPPTFLIRSALEQYEKILTAPQVGLDWSRLVHGDQKFLLKRPIVAGDVFSCTATIENYRIAAGNEIVSVCSDFLQGQELVASTWSTLVVRA
jgi:hypothetical protein